MDFLTKEEQIILKLDVKNLNKLSSMVALKIYGKTEEKNFFHWEDFFSDLILYSITVDKDNKNNELKTEVVFKELEKICPYEEMDSLFFIKLTQWLYKDKIMILKSLELLTLIKIIQNKMNKLSYKYN